MESSMELASKTQGSEKRAVLYPLSKTEVSESTGLIIIGVRVRVGIGIGVRVGIGIGVRV